MLNLQVVDLDEAVGIMKLTANDGAAKLLLHCSLDNFSGKAMGDGKWRLNSTNYAFFRDKVPMSFETVFIVTARDGDRLFGSPLFLKLPISKGVIL